MKIKQYTLGVVQTNCWLLISGCEAVLIDAAEYSGEIADYIKANGLTLKYVLLTHCHFDHILGAKRFSEEFSAPIAIGEADAPALYDARLNGASSFGFDMSDLPRADRTLKEKDTISFGEVTLSVISTPGHTKGGVAYYTKGYLFSGDTLFQASIGRTDLIGGSYQTIVDTIANKLYKLGDDTTVFPGHGPTTTIGWEKKNNLYVTEK